MPPSTRLERNKKDRAGKRALCQHRLRKRCQLIVPLTEVHRLRRHQDPHSLRRHQHGAAPRVRTNSASRTARVSAASSSLTSSISIRTCPSDGAHGRRGGTGAGSRTTSGQKTGSSVGADRSTYLPCFTNRGHGDICIGCKSHPPATAFTVHPARAHRRFVFTCPWHYRIAGAIVAGDADVATLLMRRHIADSWAALEAQLRDEVTS